MLTKVIGKIGQDKGTFAGFFYGRALHFDVVAAAVDVDGLFGVVDNLGGRDDAAVAHVVVE